MATNMNFWYKNPPGPCYNDVASFTFLSGIVMLFCRVPNFFRRLRWFKLGLSLFPLLNNPFCNTTANAWNPPIFSFCTIHLKVCLTQSKINKLSKKYNLNHKLMLTFYSSAIESILTYGLTAWYAGCSAADRKALHRVIRTTEKNHRLFPSFTGGNCRHPVCLQSQKCHKNSSHSGHHHFELIPTGQLKHAQTDSPVLPARTNRFRDSFFPRVITE